MSELLADTPAARKRRKAIALVLAALALLLLIITILWWRSLPAEEETMPARPAVPVAMSAADIFAAYENDPTLAQLATTPILITAPLDAPPTTSEATLLRTPDPLLPLGAELDPQYAVQLSDVEPGTVVSLRCEGVAPGVRAPILRNCSLQ